MAEEGASREARTPPRDDGGRRRSRRRAVAAALALALGSAAATWLAGSLLPVDPALAGWNWAFGREVGRELPGAVWVWAALVPILGHFAWLLARSGARRARAALLALAVAGGLALHAGVQLAEGRGLVPLEHRLWQSGHSEFLYIAASDPAARSWATLARRYDRIVADKGWFFPPSKPPGCLMVYRAFAALAEGPVGVALARAVYGAQPPGAAAEAPLDRRLAATAIVLFPLLTALAALPLYGLARLFVDEPAALLGALLYGLTPAVAIVAMHLDNALYPLVGVTALLLVAEAARRSAWPLALAGGVLLSLGAFVSFSLVPLGLLGAALPFVWSLPPRGAAAPSPPRPELERPALEPAALAAVFVAGALAVHAVLAVAFGYDVRARLAGAVEFHRRWWSGDGRDWRLGNLVQLAVWVGPPVAVAFAAEAAAGLRALRRWDRRSAFAVAAAATLGCMTLSGTAKSEVMRLWEFFVPLLAAVAAGRLRDADGVLRGLYVPAVLAAQVAFALAVHAHRSP